MNTRRLRFRTLAAALCLVSALAGPAPHARAEHDRLLCLDRDALPTTPFIAGAVWNVSSTGPAFPQLEVSTGFGAPELEYPGALAQAPDGTTYFTDHRVPGDSPGRIYRFECGSSAAELIAEDPRLVHPVGLAVMADGQLLVADPEADPSGLGADPLGGRGPGAIFRVDPATGMVTLFSDGTDHAPMPNADPTAFVEPVDVAVDPASGAIHVLDAGADPLYDASAPRAAYRGAVYSLHPENRNVTLVSSSPAFVDLMRLGVRTDGKLVVADRLKGDSVIWEVDPAAAASPESNTHRLTGGAQYEEIVAVTVDASNRVFFTDLGVFDVVLGRFTVSPSLWTLDETNTDPETNGFLLLESETFITPIDLVAEPACPTESSLLAISPRVDLRDPPSIRHQAAFDPVCAAPGLRICVAGSLAQPLRDIRLAGEAAPVGTNSVVFYVHSDAIFNMVPVIDGGDLIFTVP